MDNFELEAAMESGEFDAVMSEIKRIDDEAKKKGAYILIINIHYKSGVWNFL